MSMRDAIAEAVRRGELSHLPHLLPGISPVRSVFVTNEVKEFVVGPATRKLAHMASNGRRVLDSFTAGNRIVVSLNPHMKPLYCQLSRNDPREDGIWEFRLRDPKPQVRLFGGFAECDVFIALSVTLRDEIDNFRLAVADNSSIWGSLFPHNDPVTGDDINAYLSRSSDPK